MGQRTIDATDDVVESALASRQIVRTWPLRGTLHFIPAEDARWMLRHFAPRVQKAHAARLRRAHGLDQRALSAACRQMEATLKGGRSLTREEMYTELADAGLPVAAGGGLQMLWYAAHVGLVCFGPRRGRQQTIVLLEEWLPPSPGLERDEALAKLAERYFRSHGPATTHDFAWWSGLTMADAREAVANDAGRLDRREVQGSTYWAWGERTDLHRPEPRARLLPPFDEFTVAYRDREAVIQRWRPERTQAGPSLLSPALLVDGQVVGSWGRSLRGKRVEVTLRAAVRLSRKEKEAVHGEAERYAAFLGRELVLRDESV